jgi:hypothetical protein
MLNLNWKQVTAGAARRDMELRDSRREIADQLSLAKRKYLFETGMDKLKTLREKREGRVAKIRMAEGFGFTREAAIILDASGQLDSQLSRLSKMDDSDINRENIRRISEVVIQKVSPEHRAEILQTMASRNTNFDSAEIADRFVNAVYSSAEGSLEKAQSILSEFDSSAPVATEPLDLGFRGLKTITPEDTNTINKLVDNVISSNFGNLVKRDSQTGNLTYEGEAAPQVGRIRRQLIEAYQDMYYNPEYRQSPVTGLMDLAEGIAYQSMTLAKPPAEIQVTPNWRDIIGVSEIEVPGALSIEEINMSVEDALATGTEDMTKEDEDKPNPLNFAIEY